MPDSVTFDRAASFYDETRGFPAGEETHIATLFCHAGNLDADSRVLEIGAGTGRIALPLAQRVGAVAALDLARPMLARLVAKRGDEPAFPVEGDAVRLPFPAGAFDAVVAVHVFHLIGDWPNALREVARVLRPGGVLMNGWNETTRRSASPDLFEVWLEASGSRRLPNIGVPRERYRSFLPDAGWQSCDEPHVHRYSFRRATREFLDQLERRVWSSTWRLSEEQVEDGLAAVRAASQALGLDSDTPLEFDATFTVEAFYPPPR